jgi:fibrillarin-like pre-rRNA processing protein
MQKTNTYGVYTDKNRLFTENLNGCKGIKVYNENIILKNNKEYRSWNPYRSKLAAAMINGLRIEIKPDYKILYLGAATGTTVSHLSDIVKNGIIYSVENSAIAMNEFLKNCNCRKNIVPIFEDAFHPERYSYFVSKVDMVYQDISQRNQANIFSVNLSHFLKVKHFGIFMIKARSIDVSLEPKKVYENVSSYLENKGFKVDKVVRLDPYEKDHATFLISN